LVCAFKPQIAYFAAHRAEDQLERLMAHIKRVAPQVPIILDAKRGDIGSTAEQYAREAFERYQADAVTLSPFMGFDSVEPYLRYPVKGVILLCRTSNPGGSDLQNQRLADDLDSAWEVLAEPIQTVMRRYALPNPYERLKELTRGKTITREAIQQFVQTLEIPEADKQRLLDMTPGNYIGKAIELAKRV
ncbi:MAG: orotidine-5'-phosphate decarboxylase, partial [Aquabacterium sp.]|uniref:orotidine-5'-phosphate decarboxylase n=1 Tax=Aquabacterium sp. TaxID=1872578 RepID=UPI002715F000